jgi:hypothetical protein
MSPDQPTGYALVSYGPDAAVLTWNGTPVAAISHHADAAARRSVLHIARGVNSAPDMDERIRLRQAGIEPPREHAMSGSGSVQVPTSPTVEDVARAAGFQL